MNTKSVDADWVDLATIFESLSESMSENFRESVGCELQDVVEFMTENGDLMPDLTKVLDDEEVKWNLMKFFIKKTIEGQQELEECHGKIDRLEKTIKQFITREDELDECYTEISRLQDRERHFIHQHIGTKAELDACRGKIEKFEKMEKQYQLLKRIIESRIETESLLLQQFT